MHFRLLLFLFLAGCELRAQEMPDTIISQNCNSVNIDKYDTCVLGEDTVRYLLTYRFLWYHDIHNKKVYSGWAVYPGFVKGRKDPVTISLAIYLMNKFNIEEFRLFKTCSLLNLSLMSARPANEYQAFLIQRDIEQNSDIYYRSKTIQQYDTVTICISSSHHIYLMNGGINNLSSQNPVSPLPAKKVKQILKEKATTAEKTGRELLVILMTDSHEQPDFSTGMLKDFIVRKMIHKQRTLSPAELAWVNRQP